MIEETDLKYWVALTRTPTIGARRGLKLIEQFSELSEIFACKNRKYIAKSLSEEALNYIAHPDWNGIEQDLKWAAKPCHHLITLNHPAYPLYLREIPDPPLVLYIKGCLESLNTLQIALVGSRNPSFSGRETAFQFAHDLAKNHITITSGLARGIDSCGHEGALKADGATIAVLGSGIDRIYPKEHTHLAEKIIAQGAIVSEFPPETPPLAKHFPQRNRIISGLSRGVLVVEAAIKSGSLVTARLANEQGREVFAIPGSIHHVLSKGCHHLIQEGARLVGTVNDIFEELGLSDDWNEPLAQNQTSKRSFSSTMTMTAEEKRIWGCIDFEPASTDLITLRSGLTIGEVSSILLSFEINDLIVSTHGGYLRKQDNP